MKLRIQLLITLGLVALLGNKTYAQSYKEMMYDMNYNFYEVVDAAEAYFETHDKGKGSGFKGYLRWKNENEHKYYPSGNRMLSHQLAVEAHERIQRNYKNKFSFNKGWVDLGPYDADNITSHYSVGIGRVESFYVDPNDSNLLYMGSRSGGFWRSTDEGANWENTTDFLPASGVNTLTVSPFGSDTVWINVRNASNGNTHGIYKSVDGGLTWNATNFNPNNLGKGGLGSYFQIYKIAHHPTIGGLVFVGTNSGLYRSTDGMNTWSIVYNGSIRDIEFHPTKSNVVYLFDYNNRDEIQRSTNTGQSFTSTAPTTNNTIAYIAVSPDEPNHVYLASSLGVWKSTNEGQIFVKINNPDEICRGFAVSDLNVDNMLYGYVDIEASTNGGDSFNQVTSWSAPRSPSYVHADVRTLECVQGRFYVGTDGYFCKSNDNGQTWTKLNNGTGIRENYRVGVGQSSWRVNMCGSQDNGTSIYFKDDWIEWNGGDGMEALVHPLNEDLMIGSWQYGSRNYTWDGGQSRTGSDNPQKGSAFADWIAPLLLDPLDHMKVYHFGSDIFSSNGFGVGWKLVGSPDIGIIKLAAISSSNPKVMVVCRNNAIRLTTDGGQTFTNINNPVTNEALTYINFDPANDQRIVITYGSYQANNRKIYISHDRGSNWENITYNLGNMPLRSVVIDRHDSSYIYVGAEIGIYYKSMSATHWNLYNPGLPNVTVKDLKIHEGSNTLRAATWGRGLWEYSLVDRNDYPSILTTVVTTPPRPQTTKRLDEQEVEAVISYEGTIASAYLLYSYVEPDLDHRIELSLKSDSTWLSNSPIPKSPVGHAVYFQVIAVGDHGDTSKTVVFNYKSNYCEAVGSSSTGDDYITSVFIDAYSNFTGKDQYTYYSDTTINLQMGVAYDLIVGLNALFDDDKAGAWIDLNQDAVFDSTEAIDMSDYNVDKLSTGKIVLPHSVNTGDILRLRVRNSYWENESLPCGTDAGEVEDYNILVLSGVGIAPTVPLQVLAFPNPSSGIVNFEMAGTQDQLDVKVWDLQGRLLKTLVLEQVQRFKLEMDPTVAVYIVELNNGSQLIRKKILLR